MPVRFSIGLHFNRCKFWRRRYFRGMVSVRWWYAKQHSTNFQSFIGNLYPNGRLLGYCNINANQQCACRLYRCHRHKNDHD